MLAYLISSFRSFCARKSGSFVWIKQYDLTSFCCQNDPNYSSRTVNRVSATVWRHLSSYTHEQTFKPFSLQCGTPLDVTKLTRLCKLSRRSFTCWLCRRPMWDLPRSRRTFRLMSTLSRSSATMKETRLYSIVARSLSSSSSNRFCSAGPRDLYLYGAVQTQSEMAVQGPRDLYLYGAVQTQSEMAVQGPRDLYLYGAVQTQSEMAVQGPRDLYLYGAVQTQSEMAVQGPRDPYLIRWCHANSQKWFESHWGQRFPSCSLQDHFSAFRTLLRDLLWELKGGNTLHLYCTIFTGFLSHAE